MFSEKYCNASTGSNMNGGTDESATPAYSATNGGWNSGTGVFTPTSGDPSAVSPTLVGQDANVFLDGATAPVFIGRVTAVSSTTVTVSTTAKSGTAPTTGGTGISINVGGVWKGPNGAVKFPFNFITNAQTNAAGDYPRGNLKNNATYSISAAITHSNTGPIRFEGYTTTPGDGGRATVDAGGNSIAIFQYSGAHTILAYLIAQNNAGGQMGILNQATNSLVEYCVAKSISGQGFYNGQTSQTFRECEAYSCGGSAFDVATGDVSFVRCNPHDNTGVGFSISAGCIFLDCIAESNGSHGWSATVGATNCTWSGCDAYNNTGDGIRLANTSTARFIIENSNFVKNSGYGVNGSGAGARHGEMQNCGFGSGTQVNTSGATTGLSAMAESGSITYAANVTPWVDPANGDFRINLAAAKGTGRGTFTQTAASYAGTVGYPDVGAGQHQDSGGTSGGFIIGG